MKILERSLEIAQAAYPTSFEGRGRTFHVSLIWDKSKLLCLAENSLKGSPRNRFNTKFVDKGTCSEMNVFIKAKNTLAAPRWDKLTLVNVRIDRNGKVCNSLLCHACNHLVFNYLGMNPKNVYYTNKEGNFKNLKNEYFSTKNQKFPFYLWKARSR